MMAYESIRTQTALRLGIGWVAFAVWLFSLLMIWARLGSMQTEGLGQIALASLAVCFGYTSVLYGRARALEDGAWRRRTLVAAEKALRGIIFHVFSIVLGAAIIGQLQIFGYGARKIDWEARNLLLGLDPVPLFMAGITVAIFQTAVHLYYASVKTLTHRGFLYEGYEHISSRHKKFFLTRRRSVAHKVDSSRKP